MKLHPLLLAPALVLAGTYSGSVTALDGTPIRGAVVVIGTDSVQAGPEGSWTLARMTSIARGKASPLPGARNLRVVDGHLRVAFQGADITGRLVASASTCRLVQDTDGPETIRWGMARSAAIRDTLRIYWKGKRLALLDIPTDTGDIAFRIDTAWQDDFGYPRNPRIAYGSLLDVRDGRTYRTVTMFGKRWMAENLDFGLMVPMKSNFSLGDSLQVEKFCPKDSLSLCAKYGGAYLWSEAMGLPGRCNSMECAVTFPHRGACPQGWHIPSLPEWVELEDSLPWARNDHSSHKNSLAGWHLKTVDRSYDGGDSYGFGARTSEYFDLGYDRFDSWFVPPKYRWWKYWTSTEDGSPTADAVSFHDPETDLGTDPAFAGNQKVTGLQVRCLED